ncbi:MAG: adenylate/guanylate cyclase domain-containing protein [Nitrospirota bacterium]
MEITKKFKVNIFIGVLLTILIAGYMLLMDLPALKKIERLKFLRFSLLETIEGKFYDYRFKMRGEVKPPDNIVIAVIDEKTIARLGRWPFRDKLAKLIDKLAEGNAGIIVFDVICSEKDKNDPILAKAIGNAGNVILPVVFNIDKEVTESVKYDNEFLLRSAFISVKNPEMFNKYNPISAYGVLVPVPEIIKEAMSLGHIDMFPDSDGTLRLESLIIEYNGYLYPSITLQTLSAYLGVPFERVVVDATRGVQIGKKYIPTDEFGMSLINYYGKEQTFEYISVSDIVEGNVPSEFFDGKIVLIGGTAIGIQDLRVTPFSAAMAGVEKHASVIASILENKYIRKSSLATNLAILLSSGFIFSFLVTRFRAIGALGVTGMTLLLLAFSGYYAFAYKGSWINLTYPSINMLLIFVSVTAYNYATEERYAKKIRAMFSCYVTKKVVDELIKNPDMAKLGGERREITVLFSDIRGFTAFSEKHAPEEVVSILNEYLGAMTEIVFRWEGTLDKFVGDAIIAFWGAPMKQENHAELAVRCALDMIRKIEELQHNWRSEGKAPLDMGIGINSGEVLVGNIGAEGKKMEYTVIGDHVNLGARIESLTRIYNTHILITEFTMNNIRDRITDNLGHLLVKGLERVTVKGKEMSVQIFEVKSVEPGTESTIIECKKEEVIHLKEK